MIGAASLGSAAGARNAIAFDMGGTTAKASLIEDGRLVRTQEYEFRDGISTPSRFIKAGGYLLKVPAIDIAEVGAGAGSIAWVDDGGLLQVGPRSAGAAPGPACYGLGGERATVTDANVALGLLNPTRLVGGGLELRADLARAAIAQDVAGPLDLDIETAALGIRQLAGANMVRAIRAVTVERGVDPRGFTLIAFGGSGPVHACDLADALSIRRIIVPDLSGVFTAAGMLDIDVERPLVCAFPAALEDLSSEMAAGMLDELALEADGALAAEGIGGADRTVQFEVDLRFAGQDNELSLPFDRTSLETTGIADLAMRFRAEYMRLFAYDSDEPLEVVNVRALARGARPADVNRRQARIGTRKPAEPGAREAWFEGRAVRTAVIAREQLDPTPFAGPLIIEAYDTTIVVPPTWQGRLDDFGSIVLEPI